MKAINYVLSIIILISLNFYCYSQRHNSDYKKYLEIADTDIKNDTLFKYIIFIKKDLKIVEKTHNYYKQALDNLFLAKLYFKLGSFDIAIDYNLKAINLFETIKDTVFWIFSLQNISAMYGYIGNDSALTYYSLKNLKLSKAIKDSTFIQGAYINLGAVYRDIDAHKAFEFYKKAIDISKKFNDNKGLDYIYNNIGTYFFRQNQYDSSVYYFNKALEFIDNKKKSFRASVIYSNLSETYYKLNNYKSAAKFAIKAINTDQKTMNATFTTANAYLVLVKSLAKMGNSDSIPEYLEKYYDVEQAVIKNFKSEQTAKLNVLYELGKYENKIKLLQAENKIKKTKLLFESIILIIVFLALVFVIFQNIKLNRSYKKIVEESHKSLLYKDENIKLRNKIENNNETKENDEVNINDEETLLKNLYKKIEHLMENEKLFTDPDLSINTLAQKLNTNRSYISKAINTEANKSFTEFINEYRVDEAKRLLSSPNFKNLTIEAIGQKAGFRSKSTFYRVFKNIVGVTPSFFAKNVNTKQPITAQPPSL